VLTARGLDDLAKRFQNPDKNPDLPFLWRATEWAKDGGVIALAMPARLFGRTSGKGFEAWRAVLRSVEVTGLINGADLRWSSVWKDVKMPFCVFFARNAKPGPEHRFYYAAPINEPEINGRGRFRLDYEAANPISAARVEKQPRLLKTLSFGTWLDVEVMEALSNVDNKTLETRWAEWDAAGVKTGKGYDRSPALAQKFVDFLGELPVFEKPTEPLLFGFTATNTYAELFDKNSRGQSSAHKPRREELYQPPLVIIPKAPGDDPYSPKAYLSTQAVAFSQSYYGYSCAGHPEEQWPHPLRARRLLVGHAGGHDARLRPQRPHHRTVFAACDVRSSTHVHPPDPAATGTDNNENGGLNTGSRSCFYEPS